MPWLKGPRVGGSIEVDDDVKFTGSILAQNLNISPWSDVYYIDNDNGSDDYDGLTPSRAFSTLTEAVTNAGEEDIIYVRGKGAKTDASDYSYIEEGAQVTIPYASVNLSIIGVTSHRTKPYYGVWFQHGANEGETGYVLLNYAPGLCLENINFSVKDYIRSSYGGVHMYASATGGAYTTHAGSVGFSVYNCFFRDGQLNVTGGYDGVADNCTFEASGSANSGFWSTSNSIPTGGHQIRNSYFGEMFGDNQALRYIYFVAGAQKNILVDNCRFGDLPADNHYMWFGSVNTGLISNCHFSHDDVVASNNDSTSEIYIHTNTDFRVAGCYDGSGLVTTS